MADPEKTDSSAGLASGENSAWARCADLGCEFTVEVPLPAVRIADLVRLTAGSVVDSHWKVGSDVPARVNGVVIAWGEFEVVGSTLAIRITDLS
jgi:flagellar motor switch/type III secretory pathway protein FliN